MIDVDSVIKSLKIMNGHRVADLGFGSGFWISKLSKAVGPIGKVYAIDVDRSHIDSLGKRVESENLTNVVPVWGNVEIVDGTRLKPGSVDICILSNSLFQFSDRPNALREIYRILSRGGKLLIIDSYDHISLSEAESVLREAGFELAHRPIDGVSGLYFHLLAVKN